MRIHIYIYGSNVCVIDVYVCKYFHLIILSVYICMYICATICQGVGQRTTFRSPFLPPCGFQGLNLDPKIGSK